ncbi:inorganic pyrophosphatase [Aeoliella sp. ICT_H6.2]|uniref:inorganic diphosphatase n=1 Tax=Aeoliella straminimaris TaxID=2954799 RepID=A0A9X2F765_9BACT|nr:inorganic pyrophosphatase [Aeoliella straminimaris]MCO6043592.1 inorganic pyrophosphatase [Aeoliella straminimaris]
MGFPSPFYRWRPHPWHGLDVGPQPPTILNAYIELTPFDRVKYELDKKTGYLRVDRPNRTSSFCPTLYGFIPQTYCGKRVKEMMPGAKAGDSDPLDICVISERPIQNSEVILSARVVGGLPMLDNGEADDKIIAVLDADAAWMGVEDVSQLPSVLVDRLRHYFSTYKMLSPDEDRVKIDAPYGRKHAENVIKAAMEDYVDHFGGE